MTAQEQRQAAKELLGESNIGIGSQFKVGSPWVKTLSDGTIQEMPANLKEITIFAGGRNLFRVAGKVIKIDLLDLITLQENLGEIVDDLMKQIGGEA